MGRLPLHEEHDEDECHRLYGEGFDPEAPQETHDDGCPGGWYRAEFPASVAEYARLLTEHGFSGNPRLDRTDDPLVFDAVAYLETERMRHRNHVNEQMRPK